MRTLCAVVVLMFVVITWFGMYIIVTTKHTPKDFWSAVGVLILAPAIIVGVWTQQELDFELKRNKAKKYEISL